MVIFTGSLPVGLILCPLTVCGVISNVSRLSLWSWSCSMMLDWDVSTWVGKGCQQGGSIRSSKVNLDGWRWFEFQPTDCEGRNWRCCWDLHCVGGRLVVLNWVGGHWFMWFAYFRQVSFSVECVAHEMKGGAHVCGPLGEIMNHILGRSVWECGPCLCCDKVCIVPEWPHLMAHWLFLLVEVWLLCGHDISILLHPVIGSFPRRPLHYVSIQ